MTLEEKKKGREISMDFSTMSDYLKCPLRGYYRHDLNIVPLKPSPALSFGQAIHEALASWYKERDRDSALHSFVQVWEAYLVRSMDEQSELGISTPLDDEKRNLGNGLAILSNYFDTYEEEPFELLSNEFPFQVPLGTLTSPDEKEGVVSFSLTGKLDLYIKWGDYTYIVDHKTTSALGPQFFKQFSPSLQMDGYVHAAREIFGKCEGVLINAILVAKTKMTFERDIFTKTDEDIELYKTHAKQIMWDIEQKRQNQTCYRNTDACTLYGACPYLELCQAKGDERVMRMRYRTESWSPFNT